MSNTNPRVRIAFSYAAGTSTAAASQQTIPVTVQILRGGRPELEAAEAQAERDGIAFESRLCADDGAAIDAKIAEWVEGHAYHHRSLGGDLANIVVTRA